MRMSRAGLIFDERFLAHGTGGEDTVMMRRGSFRLSPVSHPSSTFITKRVKEFLDGSGLTAQMLPVEARAATEDEVAAYHTHQYIACMRGLVASCAQVPGNMFPASWACTAA